MVLVVELGGAGGIQSHVVLLHQFEPIFGYFCEDFVAVLQPRRLQHAERVVATLAGWYGMVWYVSPFKIIPASKLRHTAGWLLLGLSMFRGCWEMLGRRLGVGCSDCGGRERDRIVGQHLRVDVLWYCE